MTRKTIDFPTPPGARERLIGRMLEAEGVTCLADLIPRPYVVGFYPFDEPITYVGPVDAGPATFQYSDFDGPLAEGETPPEDSWHDLADSTVTRRYFRILQA